MKKIKLTTVHLSLLGVGVVVLAAIALMRSTPLSVKLPKSYFTGPDQASVAQGTSATSTYAVPDGLPAPTSAHFENGDALQALGPNWAFLNQYEMKDGDSVTLDGTQPVRETMAQLIGNDNIGLLIQEDNIVDRQKLEKALTQDGIKKTQIGLREGYVIPMGGLAGGSAFLLTGTSTVLILQDANAANWPDEPHPEVQIYISSVNVP